jgi:hypothetical protein
VLVEIADALPGARPVPCGPALIAKVARERPWPQRIWATVTCAKTARHTIF